MAKRDLVKKLMQHGIDPDMPRDEAREHAEHVAGEVLRGRGARARRRAIDRALSVKDMLRDIDPRR